MKKTNSLVLVLVLGFVMESAKADFTFGTPTNLGPTVNSSSIDWGPHLSADGLSLYFTSYRPGGFGDDDMYVSTRATTDDDWGPPVNLGSPINTSSCDQFPYLSADGLTLYFSSRRPGGLRGDDLWVATRETTDGPWGTPVNLGPTINSMDDDFSPSLSGDELSLYFTTLGTGTYDIWILTRETTEDDWSEPVNLGPPVNSSRFEGLPDISDNGLALFFQSDRPGGLGFWELWVSRRATTDDAWGEPVHLEPPVNSSAHDQTVHISGDGSTLYFASDRPGGLGDMDIWQVSIIPVVDFNSDGKVDFNDFRRLAHYWGQDEPSCDIAPLPFGDGIVDIQDLILFSEYLLAEFRPVAHWRLDEAEGSVAYDSAGDNDGTVHGSPAWQPASGKIHGALQLDGSEDYIDTPFILDPAKGSFSALAWVKGGAPGQVIISQTDSTEVGQEWLWADPSSGRLITWLMHPPFDPLESESIITDGQWHHVGLVYDFMGLHRTLYVDGSEVAKDTGYVGGVGSEGGLHIGVGKTLDRDSFWSGLIDEVCIYNAALSAEEMEALVY